MRITTRSIMQGYNRNLNLALKRWNTAQNRVLTQRNFNKISEDPAGANRAFQLRRQFRNNATQMELTQQTQSLMDQVTSSAMQISGIMTKDINPDVLKAVNGTNSPDERKAYAETLKGMQQSIVLLANSQVGGRYIFGGASTKEVPFELDAAGNFTYRGINVDTGVPLDPNDQNTLDTLANETLYVDLGFGLEEANDKVINTSAFNTSTPGISMLGYGKDEEGMSNNVVVLLGQLATELEKENFNEDAYGKLMDKYQDCINNITDYEANLGTKQQFLSSNLSRLEQYNDTINERIVSVEQVDMAEAISNYTWQGYAYNAALKVGTDIVSQSLLDFMK